MELDPIIPYRQAWKEKIELEKQRLEERRKKLRKVAKQLAEVLRAKYKLNEIFLIGSVATNQPISGHSDIDLVVKGIPDAEYFHILSYLYGVLPKDVELDLIPYESAEESLQKRIKKEGVRL